jgi:hypothetical protein
MVVFLASLVVPVLAYDAQLFMQKKVRMPPEPAPQLPDGEKVEVCVDVMDLPRHDVNDFELYFVVWDRSGDRHYVADRGGPAYSNLKLSFHLAPQSRKLKVSRLMPGDVWEEEVIHGFLSQCKYVEFHIMNSMHVPQDFVPKALRTDIHVVHLHGNSYQDLYNAKDLLDEIWENLEEAREQMQKQEQEQLKKQKEEQEQLKLQEKSGMSFNLEGKTGEAPDAPGRENGEDKRSVHEDVCSPVQSQDSPVQPKVVVHQTNTQYGA